ncbi:MAG: hypothetical protein ACK4IS_13340 [Erythrobacter sp.]
MPNTFSRETQGKLDAAGRSAIEPHAYRAKLHRLRATIDYSGQAAGDTITLGDLPAGSVFAFGVINPSAGAGGTAQIAIGTAEATGKYRAAATANAAGPALFGVAAAASGNPLAKDERVIATISAAALPNNANYMVVDIFYSTQG